AEPPPEPAALVEEGRRLLADLDAGVPLGGAGLDTGGSAPAGPPSTTRAAARGGEARRRRWLRAQAVGLHTTARRLAGEPIAYADEVEACYGVRPAAIPDDVFAEAHRRLDEALPGTGDLRERVIAWREGHAVP